MNDCGIRWGATVADANVLGGDRREWDVTVESEPLASHLNDRVLGRFADAAALEAGGAASCSRSADRIGMTMTVQAAGIDEAADRAAHTFRLALAAALWPRYQPSTSAQWRVQVAPAGAMLAAA